MDFLCVEGGKRLQGSINISGAKNAALPLIALSLLSKEQVTLHNLPNVVDIKTFFLLLKIIHCNT